MPDEQYANRATTTINDAGGISAGDLSVTVTDGSVFPASGDFMILIEDEYIRVTARSGNNLTIVRAQEGSVAVSHADGTDVTHVVTEESLIRLATRIHLSGTIASRSAADRTNEGSIQLPSNGYSAYRSNGSLWVPSGPLFPFTEPVDGDFAWINQGGASVDTARGGIYLLAPATAGDQNRIRKKSAPSTPYTVTAALYQFSTSDQAVFFSSGLCFREAGTGKLIVWNLTRTVGPPNFRSIQAQKWNSETSFSASYSGSQVWSDLRDYQIGGLVWQQIADDGVNLHFRLSQDGVHFQNLLSVSRTDFMAGGPDEIGFFANANSATYDIGLLLLSWSES